MKKLILAAGVMGAALLGVAAANNDPVLMNIAGKDVHLSEFEYLYHKNNSQQVQPQTLDEYVEMFVNYKLKVADAEAHGIDTTAAFMSEFNQFRNELAQPYLVDLAVQDSIVNSIYSQMTDELVVSHIMMHEGSEAKLDSLRTAILDGTAKFEEVAAQYSIDRASSSRGGYMGVVAFGRYPQAFEEMAYSTPVGQISPVVNSGYGIHIIRVDDRHPSEGEVLVEHILRVTRGATDSVAAAEEVRIDSIYNVVTAPGADFGEIASRLSQDGGSARNGGKLDWFGRGIMVAEFDSVAFALPVGAYSRPFRTSYGWHIIHKLDARKVGSLEETRQGIINNLGRDARGNAPRIAFMYRMIKEHNGRVLRKNASKIAQRAEQLGGVLDSAMIAEFSTWNLPIFEIAGKKGTVADVMPTLSVAALRGGDNIAQFIIDGASVALGNRAMDIARDELMVQNPDYRNLVNEYRDGILLFDISNTNVWERASKDKQGLEEFFRNNREKYTFDQPKFKSFIIFASNDTILGEAEAFATTLPANMDPAEIVSTIHNKFGRNVKVERVIAAKGENPITDFLGFGGPRPDTSNNRWKCFVAYRGRVIDAPEEASDVRGAVVADFQAALEKDWIEQLRAKYPVKINRKVLGQVK